MTSESPSKKLLLEQRGNAEQIIDDCNAPLVRNARSGIHDMQGYMLRLLGIVTIQSPDDVVGEKKDKR